MRATIVDLGLHARILEVLGDQFGELFLVLDDQDERFGLGSRRAGRLGGG